MRGASILVPAPVAGLNLRDDITALKPNEALELENWFPDLGKLSMRPGFASYASSLGAASVQTLIELAPASTSLKFVAGAGGHLYNITSSGSGSSIGSGFSQNRWQTAKFNARIFLVNGTDSPQDWDGTTLTSTSWSGSGLTITDLVNIANVRNRLWFCENSSADVWYGAIGGVTGALTKFQLSQIASGGYCMAIGSWSRDAGDGMDDFTVFVMSTGQIIVYQGDPSSTFSLIGKYDTGAEPLGRQCLIKIAGELVIITRLGLLPLSAAIGGKALDLKAINPWGKIAPLIVDYAKSYGDNTGWHGVLHLGVLYINVPQTSGVLSKQIILNTRTGAWSLYSGWNGESFGVFNNDLYFGSPDGGTARKVTPNTDDNGTQISGKARCAFITPGNRGSNTFTYTAVRPRLNAQGTVTGSVSVDTDFFENVYPTNTVDLSPSVNTTPWGSPWGSAWGSHPEPVNNWYSVIGDGRSVAVKLRTYSNASVLEWTASDVLMIPGNIK